MRPALLSYTLFINRMPAAFCRVDLIGKHDAAGMCELLPAIADFATRRGPTVSSESEAARWTGLLRVHRWNRLGSCALHNMVAKALANRACSVK